MEIEEQYQYQYDQEEYESLTASSVEDNDSQSDFITELDMPKDASMRPNDHSFTPATKTSTFLKGLVDNVQSAFGVPETYAQRLLGKYDCNIVRLKDNIVEELPYLSVSQEKTSMHEENPEQYELLMFQTFASKNKGVRTLECPRNKCLIFVNTEESGSLPLQIKCECGHCFCSKCLETAHWPVSCHEFSKFKENEPETKDVEYDKSAYLKAQYRKLLELADKNAEKKHMMFKCSDNDFIETLDVVGDIKRKIAMAYLFEYFVKLSAADKRILGLNRSVVCEALEKLDEFIDNYDFEQNIEKFEMQKRKLRCMRNGIFAASDILFRYIEELKNEDGSEETGDTSEEADESFVHSSDSYQEESI